jgi:hypothetical protein
MARRVFRLRALADAPRLIQLARGTEVSGRITHQGRPLKAIAIALVHDNRVSGDFLGEWTATTDDDGRFQLRDVSPGQEYELCFKMASLKRTGAIAPRHVRVGSDGTSVDVGEVPVGPAYKIAGRVMFAGGRAVPAGTVAHASVMGGWDGTESPVDPEGRFELHGLPACAVTVAWVFPGNQYAPKGYRLAESNQSLNREAPWCLTGRVDHDLTGLTVLFEPGPGWPYPVATAADDADPPQRRPLTGVVQGESK